LMREEIWTEKIFKDDAGYFLRITKPVRKIMGKKICVGFYPDAECFRLQSVGTDRNTLHGNVKDFLSRE
ncbi:hypothetical protein, partial [Prevotellamassilia timonensis]|uniref:hypothetical protein n=1 Tax=Prevotellamassilia timonensis TaxID=1852370 RepID=UPI001F19EC6D